MVTYQELWVEAQVVADELEDPQFALGDLDGEDGLVALLDEAADPLAHASVELPGRQGSAS